MDRFEICGLLAGIVSMLAMAIYAISTVRGKTKPSRSGWFIWTIVGIMLGASYYASGAPVKAMWVPISFIIGPLVISILSIWYGENNPRWTDKWCLSGALTSAVLWGILIYIDVPHAALAVLSINIVMDFLGVIPTIQHSKAHPEEEDLLAWILSSLSSVIHIGAVSDWQDIAVVSYPLYMLMAVNYTTYIIYRGYRQNHLLRKE